MFQTVAPYGFIILISKVLEKECRVLKEVRERGTSFQRKIHKKGTVSVKIVEAASVFQGN